MCDERVCLKRYFPRQIKPAARLHAQLIAQAPPLQSTPSTRRSKSPAPISSPSLPARAPSNPTKRRKSASGSTGSATLTPNCSSPTQRLNSSPTTASTSSWPDWARMHLATSLSPSPALRPRKKRRRGRKNHFSRRPNHPSISWMWRQSKISPANRSPETQAPA